MGEELFAGEEFEYLGGDRYLFICLVSGFETWRLAKQPNIQMSTFSFHLFKRKISGIRGVKNGIAPFPSSGIGRADHDRSSFSDRERLNRIMDMPCVKPPNIYPRCIASCKVGGGRR